MVSMGFSAAGAGAGGAGAGAGAGGAGAGAGAAGANFFVRLFWLFVDFFLIFKFCQGEENARHGKALGKALIKT